MSSSATDAVVENSEDRSDGGVGNDGGDGTLPSTQPTQQDGCDSDPKSDSEAASASATASQPSWDHANRRVLVQNVHRYDDAKKMGKLLTEWAADIEKSTGVAIDVEKIKKPPKDNWMTVTLRDEKMVEPLISYVNATRPRTKNGSILFAKRQASKDVESAGSSTRPISGNKRGAQSRSEHDNESKFTKRQKLIEESRQPTTDEEVKDAIVPLWRESYEEQLRSKVRDLIKNCALKIVKECKARCHQLAKEKDRKGAVPLYAWLQGKTPIRIPDVVPVPSPVRNKVEFTFGYRYLFETASRDGDEADSSLGDSYVVVDADTTDDRPQQYKRIPSVGVCARGWAGGVSLPHPCPNIPREACAIVDVVEKFLKDRPLPVYDTVTHTGVWRTLTLRCSHRTREMMIVIMHSPASGGQAEAATPGLYAESFESEKDRLLQKLTKAELSTADSAETQKKVTSVFFQEFDGLSHPSADHPVQHAYGKTHLTERLGDCVFHISPGAFFQVNTEGAEILYQKVMDKVRELSPNPKETLLFDVCCGTGTIGIACLKAGVVGRVIGVDISVPAIRDAEQNAELNGFGESPANSSHNADNRPPAMRFIASRAEDVLGKEISKAREQYSEMEFVAVVDPAREGLHGDVCKTLRANSRIRRIVYVSCNPTGTLVRDAGLLCAPPTKRYSGRPFKVSSATPVDMFPMTSHCELVVTFDRLTEEELADSANS